MISTLEVVVYYVVASMAAAFIGLAVAVPARVDQTMMDIPIKGASGSGSLWIFDFYPDFRGA